MKVIRTTKSALYTALVIAFAVGLVLGGVFGGLIGKTAANGKNEANTSIVEMSEQPLLTIQEEKEPYFESLGEFKLTAYCSCEKCCGYWATIRPKDENGNPIVKTASGVVATEGRTIATDPEVIPYGTEVKINSHTYIAEDCGGAIKGNKIDVYFSTHEAAREFGVQTAEVYVKC